MKKTSNKAKKQQTMKNDTKHQNLPKYTVGQYVFVHQITSRSAYDFFHKRKILEILNHYSNFGDYNYTVKYLVGYENYTGLQAEIVDEKDIFEYDERIAGLASIILDLADAHIRTSEIIAKPIKGQRATY